MKKISVNAMNLSFVKSRNFIGVNECIPLIFHDLRNIFDINFKTSVFFLSISCILDGKSSVFHERRVATLSVTTAGRDGVVLCDLSSST